ncbi:MAG: sulfotransferase domain-containing protein [Pseudomonadota bacterium]
MRHPNFFLIGAPKCGTTALANWLAARPDVFMSPVKEPHHFNTDGGYPGVADRAAYERLFDGAGAAHRAVGEASVGYLSSEVAVSNLLARYPEARLIACLRNPLDMLPSLHQQYVFNGTEPLGDFAEAWAASERRRAEAWRAPSGSDWQVFHYPRMGLLGAQVDRLFATAGPARCLILTLEEMNADPKGVFARVLHHIGAAEGQIGPLGRANAAKAARAPVLRALMTRAAALKRRLGWTRSLGLARGIDRLNRVEQPWTPLPAPLSAEMAETFRADIALLSRLLNRDFSYWLDPERKARPDAAHIPHDLERSGPGGA